MALWRWFLDGTEWMDRRETLSHLVGARLLFDLDVDVDKMKRKMPFI